VLDTNAWLDWLVFDDPAMRPIREAIAGGRAEVFIDAPCLAELADVLARPFKNRPIDPAAALAEVRKAACEVDAKCAQSNLPVCRDPDDQKFLELAAAAHADILVTKDTALLELAKRRNKPPFRIQTALSLSV
jgi:putative PIN family toxin of toxin-antitoxin system